MKFYLCKEILIFLVIFEFISYSTHYLSHVKPDWSIKNSSHAYEHHNLDFIPDFTYHHIPFFEYLWNWTLSDSAVHFYILFSVLAILLLKSKSKSILVLMYVFLLHFLFVSTMHYMYHLKPDWKISKHHQTHHNNNGGINFSVSPFGCIFDTIFGTR